MFKNGKLDDRCTNQLDELRPFGGLATEIKDAGEVIANNSLFSSLLVVSAVFETISPVSQSIARLSVSVEIVCNYLISILKITYFSW